LNSALPPITTPLPYTTLFRSRARLERAGEARACELRVRRDGETGRVRSDGGLAKERLRHGVPVRRYDLQLRGRLLQRDVDDRVADRKSTRLNSSHGSISYAVF